MTHRISECNACPVCGSRKVRFIFSASEDRDEWRCSGCGALFYWPLPTPEEQKAFYDSQWSESGSEYVGHFCDPAYEAANLRNSFLPRLDRFAKQGLSGRLLDVGCSVGTFLKAAKERGWDVRGIDLGQQACARTAESVGCRVHCGTIETAELEPGSFDVVHASQVIEHVLDPRAFVQAARRLTRPGGALLLATPVVEPVVFNATFHLQKWLIPRVSGGRERPFPWAVHYPFHVIVQTTRSLRLLLESQGFEIVHIRLVPWMHFTGMNTKWRAFYRAMNVVFRLTGSGMNVDMLAIRH